jgi:NTE family protein
MKNHRIWRALLLVVVLAWSAAGLQAQNQNGLVNISYDPKEDSIFFAKMQKRMAQIRKQEHRPTVALVLAGGGAKGAAHIGVLKVLEEKGIPVDLVAGTSMGGLMGGLYAMGYSAEAIDSIVRSIDWNVMMSDNIPMEFYTYTRKNYKGTYILDIPFNGGHFLRSLPSGVLYGLNIYNMLSALSVGYQQDMDFINMPTPYCCVATEVVSQKEKHWTSGSLIDAMRSTMSIPGYFRPVRIDSMILSDGGTKNNFPVDVAKAAGADIIIGVELTMPRDFESVNNMADILMQTAQYSGGLEAHTENVKKVTVYITPDISGFGMLSFSTEDIATLINRGYTAAKAKELELDSLVRIVGSSGRELHSTPAINTATTKVKITDVEYEGVSPEEEEYIDGKVRLKPNEYYDREDLELHQAIIYGTMAFSQVTYRLISDGADGYKLLFRCQKRPLNSIGIGLRADSEEWLSMIINGGFGKNKIFGSIFDVTIRLSMAPYLKLNWYYLPKKGPKFGVTLKTQYRMQIGSTGNDFNYTYYKQYWQNEVRAYIAGTRWSQVDLNAGVRLEHTPFYKQIGETPDTLSRPEWDWKHYYPYVYLRLVYDHEDKLYFPNKGFKLYVSYDYNFKRTHFAATGIHGVIPVCKIFAIQASLNGRYILGGDPENINMRNYVGGVMPGRYYEQQIPFVGFNGERLCDNLLTTVDLDFRFRIGKKYYLSLIGAAMHDGNSLEGFKAKHAIFAAALQLAYNSKFGPLMANVHWNSFNNKLGIYLSAGFDF